MPVLGFLNVPGGEHCKPRHQPGFWQSALAFLAGSTLVVGAARQLVRLDDLPPVSVRQGFGQLHEGASVEGRTVRIRNLVGLSKVKGEALHPGADTTIQVPATSKDGALELDVLLKRGGAMVNIFSS